jgi:hypothetical protein
MTFISTCSIWIMANIIIYQELVDDCEIFISKMAMNLFYIVFILSSNNDTILHVHSNMSDTAGVLYEAEIVYPSRANRFIWDPKCSSFYVAFFCGFTSFCVLCQMLLVSLDCSVVSLRFVLCVKCCLCLWIVLWFHFVLCLVSNVFCVSG